MATVTLRPSADGTVTGWAKTGGGSSLASAIVDDPDSNDGDTSYVLSPNASDGTMFVLLDDVPVDFNPGAINSISIKISHRRINTPQMTVDDGTVNARLTRSDESTAISTTPTAVNSPIQAGYLTTTFSPTVSGTHSVSDWNGARLALTFDHTSQQTVDTVNQIRITAAEVVIDYTPADNRNGVTAATGSGAVVSVGYKGCLSALTGTVLGTTASQAQKNALSVVASTVSGQVLAEGVADFGNNKGGVSELTGFGGIQRAGFKAGFST